MKFGYKISEIKKFVEEIDNQLDLFHLVYYGPGGPRDQILHVYLTHRLKEKCKKGKIWKSKPFLITLRNVQYGIDLDNKRSRQGKDGIFIINRKHRPINAMQKKIFDQFIDKSRSKFKEIMWWLDWDEKNVQAVRVVSHHMRLLGVMHFNKKEYELVLVDWDNTK